jgi:hypothetical protein
MWIQQERVWLPEVAGISNDKRRSPLKKLIHLTIYGRDGRPYPPVEVFIIPVTARELLERLECTRHVLTRFQTPKVFWPDENVYECVSEGDRLEVIPIVWGEAPWLNASVLPGLDKRRKHQDRGETFERSQHSFIN